MHIGSFVRFGLVSVALMLGECNQTAQAACDLGQRATIPLSMAGRAILVPVLVNGITASFLLDTGAQRSVVTDAAVRRLQLARDPWVGTTMSGVGGAVRRANADPVSLSLGGIPLVRHTLNHDTSLTVADLPVANAPGPLIDGLLGRDYLSIFDLDLDIGERRLTLYQPVGCAGRFLPWTGAYEAIPVTIMSEKTFVVPVVLDGVSLRAILDTGASSSLLAAPGMARLGLDDAKLSMDQTSRVQGLGPRIVTMHRHRFRSLRVGTQTMTEPVLWAESVRLTPIVDMLLGTDWLEGRRVWISWATGQLFSSVP